MSGERLVISINEPTLIVSDLHIGYRPSFFDLAANIISQYNTIILNGDIYDLWLADQEFLERSRESKILTKLIKNKNSIYIRGNHDWDYNGESYEAVTIDYNGLYRALIIHGHQFDPRHASAKPSLGSFLFTRFDAYISGLFKFSLQQLLHGLHDAPIIRNRVHKVLDTIRNNAMAYLDATDVDWIIHGHTHFPWLHRRADNRGIVDGGSFVVGATCVVLDDSGPRLINVAR